MEGARPVRAARGSTLSTLGWAQEGALRMLQNNLDPEVAERPDDLVVYGGHGARGARLAQLRRAGAHAAHAQGRRDDAGAVGPTGRRLRHPRVGAARADRELEPGRRLGDVAGVPSTRGARSHDVRTDDRRLVDLHRHPGDPPGHLRDVLGGRRSTLRRHARRHVDPDRRVRRAWAARSRSRSR